MKKYDKYKDSGIEWIGEIPEHWEVKKLKYVAIINPTKDHSYKDKSDDVVFLPMEKVGEDGSYNCEIKKPISELWNGFTNFEEKDIIIAKITPCFENGKCAYLKNIETKIGFGSTEFHVLRAISIEPEFLFYITRSKLFMALGEAFMTGAAGQKRVPTDFVSEFQFCFAPLTEQLSIANYLDRKTAEIDELIADKKRLLELYEEEKIAIINQAVTKGINPVVKMKDSGIEWLGEIPEHWETCPLKYLGNFINGYSFNSTDFTTMGVRVLKISNIQHMQIDWSDESFIGEAFYETHKNFRVLHNDLVFALTRPIISTGIKVALIDSDEPILLNQRNSIYRPTAINIKWVYYILLSADFIREFDSRIDKTGQQPNISSNDIAEITVPIPNENEQQNIISFIDKECSVIENKRIKTEKLIALLTEYRTALISEVVTGKIKVVE